MVHSVRGLDARNQIIEVQGPVDQRSEDLLRLHARMLDLVLDVLA
jgi:hypothetical protein